MSGFITSADAIFTITVQSLYNAPVTLENWGTDRSWETDDLEMAETQMSIDGKLNAGWVPNPVDTTLTFAANSASIIVFEAITQAQTTARAIYKIGGELTLNGTSRKYTFVNGILRTASMLPSGGRVLEARNFGIRWERVFPAGI